MRLFLCSLLFALCSFRANAQTLRDTVERYTADRDALGRRYAVAYSPARRDRMRVFYRDWQKRVDAIFYDRLDVEGRIDWHLLENGLRRELALLDQDGRRAGEMARLLPFADTISALMEARRRMETVKPRETATTLAALTRSVDSARARVESPAG